MIKKRPMLTILLTVGAVALAVPTLGGAASRTAFVAAAFERILGRPPSRAERARASGCLLYTSPSPRD